MQNRWRSFLRLRQVYKFASEEKLVRRKYTVTPPSRGSTCLTCWGTRDFIIAVSSQFSRIRMYFYAENVLRVLLQAPPELARKYFASENIHTFV